MAMTTAEKAKISRQYDFLTDPDSAVQRQLVHNRLGLKPWEIAEAEAEYLRTTKLRNMSALTEQFGAPKDVTLGKEFTMPDMSRKTFSESGEQRALELPPSFSNDYSPYDQKQIEGLYKTRSEYATDPELDEQERQQAFDKIDAQISRVPRLSPMMKEPTEQQKVDARIVTVDGVKYYSDGKSLKPVNAEAVKAKTAQDEAIAKRAQVFFTDIKKANDEAVTKTNDLPRSNESMFEESRMMAQQEAGLIKPSGSKMPELDPVWTMFKSALDDKLNSQGRATESQMIELMEGFTFYADNMGISAADAKYSFLQYWQKAIDNGDPIVAKMSPKTQRRMWTVGADTIDPGGVMRSRIAEIDGLRVGEGKVTVHEDLPPGLESIWPSLDNEDKRAIRRKLEEGWTAQEILTAIGAS